MSAAQTPPHIRMSNEIAVQFRHRDPAWAAEQIAAHIRAFWDPRMRARLLADAGAGDGRLDPLVVAATALLPPAG
ncbi:formate dehydrogenase subunit delta [Nonomuraea maritima]|uniref:Formate dehydrogenase subunit delta n=1 Tax=Nonomuraea maritima TaxID=683260 RepID=A0A1G9RMH1_9ACTN|nr:formate dehydrogenase subunit delta [Nonomuraea maritima]SDM24456.1 formate dehydrogenase subunit delta [Nonomuraea maritima]